jgi:all-trans-retinol 13,14-reductase
MRISAGTPFELEHVVKPYEGSTWRLKGGGKTLVDALVKTQDIRLGKKVVSIEDREVLCADGSTFRADAIISAIHPRVTFSLVKDHVRSSYLKRLNKLVDGPGAVTLNCKLREGMLPWVDHDIFLQDKVMIHFGEKDEDGYAKSLDLMGFDPITPEELQEIAAKRLPDIRYAIEKFWVSTPATWERYTGTPGGTAFGIVKHTSADFLPPETPIPWLYLTGQNIGLHGVLGTCISALNTFNAVMK